MKRIILLTFLSSVLVSCQIHENVNIDPKTLTPDSMSQEVNSQGYDETEVVAINEKISYLITHSVDNKGNEIGGKIELQTESVNDLKKLITIEENSIVSDWKVTDNHLIFTSGLGGGFSTKVLNKFTGEVETRIPFSHSTHDGRFIVACNVSGYGPGDVQIYDVEKKRELYKKVAKGDIFIGQCHDDYVSHKTLQFTVSSRGDSELFIWDFSTGRMRDASYRYFHNSKKWDDDVLEIRKHGAMISTQTGFLNALSQDEHVRTSIGDCLHSGPERGCFPEYHLIKISPTGKYMELEQRGFETSNYEIYSLQDKKNIYSHNGYLQSSGWTPNNSQMFFISIPGMGAGSGETTGVFVSVPDKFPEFKQVTTYNHLPGCEKGECDIQVISMNDQELQLRVVSGSQGQEIWIDLKNMKIKP